MTRTVVDVEPIIRFPNHAVAGRHYVASIDLAHSMGPEDWPYEREDFALRCVIECRPAFEARCLGEPVVLLHRFGGTYGEARFLLTASQRPLEAEVRIHLVGENGRVAFTHTIPRVSVTATAAEADAGERLSVPVPSEDMQSPGTPVLWGHDAGVLGCAFSPDGRLLALNLENDTVGLHESGSGRQVAVLQGHGARINHLAFNASGNAVVTASADGTAAVWEAERDWRRTWVLPCPSEVLCVDCDAELQRVATADAETGVYLWSKSAPSDPAVLGGGPGIVSVAFSPDAKYVAAQNREGELHLWDVEQHLTVRHLTGVDRVSAGSISRLRFASAGGWLVSAFEGTFRVLEGIPDGILFEARSRGNGTFDMDAERDRAIVPSARRARLIALPSGEFISSFGGEYEELAWAALHPSGDLAVLATTSGEVSLWDTDGKAVLATWRHAGRPTWGAFSPDGRRIATAGEDGAMQVRDLDRLRSVSQPAAEAAPEKDAEADRAGPPASPGIALVGELSIPEAARCLALAPDGLTIAFAMTDGAIEIADLTRDYRPSKRMYRVREPRAISWSPDGSLLAVGGGSGEVRIYGDGGTVQMRRFDGDVGVRALAWSVHRHLAIRRRDRLEVREIANGRALFKKQGLSADTSLLAWSADGRYLLFSDDAEPQDSASLLDLEVGTGTAHALHGLSHPSISGLLQPVHAFWLEDGVHAVFATVGGNLLKFEIMPDPEKPRFVHGMQGKPTTEGGPSGYAATPDGRLVVIKDWKGRLSIIETEGFNREGYIEASEGTIPDGVALSVDGQALVNLSAGGRKIDLWDIAKANWSHRPPGPPIGFFVANTLPDTDGKPYLATAAADLEAVERALRGLPASPRDADTTWQTSRHVDMGLSELKFAIQAAIHPLRHTDLAVVYMVGVGGFEPDGEPGIAFASPGREGSTRVTVTLRELIRLVRHIDAERTLLVLDLATGPDIPSSPFDQALGHELPEDREFAILLHISQGSSKMPPIATAPHISAFAKTFIDGAMGMAAGSDHIVRTDSLYAFIHGRIKESSESREWPSDVRSWLYMRQTADAMDLWQEQLRRPEESADALAQAIGFSPLRIATIKALAYVNAVGSFDGTSESAMIDEHAWRNALEQVQRSGFKRPLSALVIFDLMISGQWPPSVVDFDQFDDISEEDWIELALKSAIGYKHQNVERGERYLHLAANGNWDLELPIETPAGLMDVSILSEHFGWNGAPRPDLGDAESLLRQGIEHQRRGRSEEAAQAFGAAREIAEQAKQESAGRDDVPETAFEAQKLIAQVQLAEGDPGGAVEAFEECRNLALRHVQGAWAAFEAAKAALLAGRTFDATSYGQLALGAYRQLKLTRDEFNVLMHLGNLAAQSGSRGGEALLHFALASALAWRTGMEDAAMEAEKALAPFGRFEPDDRLPGSFVAVAPGVELIDVSTLTSGAAEPTPAMRDSVDRFLAIADVARWMGKPDPYLYARAHDAYEESDMQLGRTAVYCRLGRIGEDPMGFLEDRLEEAVRHYEKYGWTRFAEAAMLALDHFRGRPAMGKPT